MTSAEAYLPVDVAPYEVEELLGEGAEGRTFRVCGEEGGDSYAMKCLLVDRVARRESVDREIGLLESLTHPRIPGVVETLERTDSHGRTWVCVVQELFEGPSLWDDIRRGVHHASADIERMLTQLLDILEYLHERDPPVVHRDVKPVNIVRRGSGELGLVDFGAASRLDRHADDDALMVTNGYAPPEQYVGDASPKSDLFAVGTTFLHLLTHEHPSAFYDHDRVLRFEDQLFASPKIRSLLELLLAVDPEERPSSATEARRMLTDERAVSSASDRSERSHFAIETGHHALEIAVGSSGEQFVGKWFAYASGTAALFTLAGGFAAVPISLVVFVFWGFVFGRRYAEGGVVARLVFDDDALDVQKSGVLSESRTEYQDVCALGLEDVHRSERSRQKSTFLVVKHGNGESRIELPRQLNITEERRLDRLFDAYLDHVGSGDESDDQLEEGSDSRSLENERATENEAVSQLIR